MEVIRSEICAAKMLGNPSDCEKLLQPQIKFDAIFASALRIRAWSPLPFGYLRLKLYRNAPYKHVVRVLTLHSL